MGYFPISQVEKLRLLMKMLRKQVAQRGVNHVHPAPTSSFLAQVLPGCPELLPAR